MDLERILGRMLEDFWKDLEGQTMIRATKGKSRSTNHWKGGWMVRRGPKRLEYFRGPVRCMARFFEVFFEGVFFGFFSMLGRFWKVLGGQNGGQNRFFGGFFSMFFWKVFWYRFLIVFWRLET